MTPEQKELAREFWGTIKQLGIIIIVIAILFQKEVSNKDLLVVVFLCAIYVAEEVRYIDRKNKRTNRR